MPQGRVSSAIDRFPPSLSSIRPNREVSYTLKRFNTADHQRSLPTGVGKKHGLVFCRVAHSAVTRHNDDAPVSRRHAESCMAKATRNKWSLQRKNKGVYGYGTNRSEAGICSAFGFSAAKSRDTIKHVHPVAVKGLYVVYMAACLVERTWRFAVPLVLSYIEGGYRAIAVLGFVSPLFCSLLGPVLGSILDKMYRPYGLGLMLVLQDLAIIASGLVVLATVARPGMSLTDGPLFSMLLVLSGIERLTAVLSELAIERDWVTQLSGKDNDVALATSNAILRRGDLVCEAIGALTFGWLYSTAGVAEAVAIAVLLAAVAVPLQLYCIVFIANNAPDAMVHGRREVAIAPIKPRTWKQLLRSHKSRGGIKKTLALRQITNAFDGWKTYFKQSILPSSLTFVTLFLNVALSPGGLITAFLTARGLDGKGMAVFRGGCAVMGFTGTGVGRWLIQRYGLLTAGKKALSIQLFFLIIATTTFWAYLAGPLTLVSRTVENATMMSVGKVSTPVVVFAAAVVASRIGMWSFDMVNAQLFQQMVSQREVASASAAEMALCNTNEVLMLGAAAYLISPESYGVLVLVSISAVVAANFLFRFWVWRMEHNADGDVDESIPVAKSRR